MGKTIKILLIIVFILLLFYHGCVIKAERNQEAQFFGKYHEGKISKEEYEKQKEKITYFSTFFNFKEVLKAFD